MRDVMLRDASFFGAALSNAICQAKLITYVVRFIPTILTTSRVIVLADQTHTSTWLTRTDIANVAGLRIADWRFVYLYPPI